jgi:BlaI family transcriptional regulator, penicillinase repressor
MRPNKPSQLEMQVLSLLWQKGPCTAREVLKALPDGKERAYTTVLSVMQVMEKKGLLSHDRKGNANLYKAKVRQKKIMEPVMSTLVKNLFGGSRTAAMQMLLGKDVSQEEIAEIRQLLDEIENR